MFNNGGGLLSLPDEVLVKIISSDGTNIADVLNFGQVCHVFSFSLFAEDSHIISEDVQEAEQAVSRTAGVGNDAPESRHQ